MPQSTIYCEIPWSSDELLAINAASEDTWDAIHSSFKKILRDNIDVEIALARAEPQYMSDFWEAPFGWWMPIADKAVWDRTWESFRQASTPTRETLCSTYVLS
jgi:hypothetical protein